MRYLPLKNRPIPKNLIYQKVNNKNNAISKFVIFSTDSKNPNWGYMNTQISSVERDGINEVPSLYISSLKSDVSRKGLGTDLINFAKQYSKKVGCLGNLHLFSSSIDAKEPYPHVFYRKMGFDTKIKKINKILDTCVQDGSNPTEIRTITMYYPKLEKPKRNCFQKCLDFLKGLGDN